MAETDKKIPTVELRLELEVGSEPITGRIRLGDGAPMPFFGWLGLTAAIKSLRSERFLETLDSAPREDMLQKLTPTEREVVRLVCQGLTNPQTARRLGVVLEPFKVIS